MVFEPKRALDKIPPKWRQKHVIAIMIVVAIALWGIGSRLMDAYALRSHTEEQAIANVTVIKAPQGPSSEEIVLPGNVQAWHEAPIYARTSGYLKDWKTDIGTHVKEGDVLADIETPEIDAQLQQVKADLITAQANSTLAQSTAKRWNALLKTDSVSKQEADEKNSDASAKTALVASAKANLDRLNSLESFKRVVAPFDGTITARNTDTGALINTGSSTTAPELFHIAQTDHLRIYVQVPQNYAPLITSDLEAELHFSEHPGKVFPAKLLRTADALDPTSRTLLAQFVVDNEKGELLPGGYTEVHLKLAARADSIRLPVNALIFRANGLQVATVEADNHAILKTVVLGRDFGKEVEVASGIAPGETVIVNPPDSLVSGQPVRVMAPEDKKDEKKP